MTIAAAYRVDQNGAPFMGEVKVSVHVENAYDREFADRGLWNPDRVKTAIVEMVVDTGSTLPVLPEHIVAQLGLRRLYQTPAKLADGTVRNVWIASGAQFRFLSRICIVDCVVGPSEMPALLGQIPLEEMDLLVDCRQQTLIVASTDGPRIRI